MADGAAAARRSSVRLGAARKHHLCDPSIAASLIGADPSSLAADPKTLGRLFESLVLHDLVVYASASGAFVSHYYDADGLAADAVVWRRNGDWVPVEARFGPAQVDSAAANLDRLERKMTSHGGRPPAAKVVVVGFGGVSRLTGEGVQVVPVDALGV